MANDIYMPIDVPSKCKCYPGVDEIRIRTLKGKEEELIAEMNQNNSSKNIFTIVSNVVQGIDAKQLTSGDVMYLLLWEAINSFHSLCPFNIVCGDCKEESTISIDLSKIQIDVIPDEYEYPYSVTLQDEAVLNMRPQTIGDEITQIEYMKEKKPIHILKYAQRILTPAPLHEKIQLLEEMNVVDLAKIKKEDTFSKHGPDMIGNYKCPKCGSEGSIIIPFRFKELFRVG